MSISHWGIVPGKWDRVGFTSRTVWWPMDFARWCRYMHGTDNEP